MGNILYFNGMTKVDIPPENVLEAAKGWGAEHVIIIGVDKNDVLLFGGSTSDIALANLLLDKAKMSLLTDDEFDGERIA